MSGAADSVESLQERISQIVRARGWDELRTYKDLATAIAIEAAELQEIFLWRTRDEEPDLLETERAAIESEVADIFIYLLGFVDRAGIDLIGASHHKLHEVERRHPKPGDAGR